MSDESLLDKNIRTAIGSNVGTNGSDDDASGESMGNEGLFDIDVSPNIGARASACTAARTSARAAARRPARTSARDDIRYAMKEVPRSPSCPTAGSQRMAKRFAGYLAGAPKAVNMYLSSDQSGVINVAVDADHAGCEKTRLSTSLGVIQIGNSSASRLVGDAEHDRAQLGRRK